MNDFLKKISSEKPVPPARQKMRDIVPRKEHTRPEPLQRPEMPPAPPIPLKREKQKRRRAADIEERAALVPPKMPAAPQPPLLSHPEEATAIETPLQKKNTHTFSFHWPTLRRHTLSGMRRPRSVRITRAAAISAFAALIVALVVLSTVFAKFTITLRPMTAAIAIPATDIVADTKASAADPAQKIIPALKIEVKKSSGKTFPSTGEKYIQDFAHGTITVYNAYSSAPQALIRGTRFASSSGKVFTLTKGITVPGARIEGGKVVPSAIDADVIAQNPGDAYNIPPDTFTIPGLSGSPKFNGFYGKSSAAFQGGFQGNAKVVTANDITTAEEEVTQELVNELKADLQGKTPPLPDITALDGSRTVAITGITAPHANDRMDTFTLSADGVADTIVFRKTDLGVLLSAVYLSPDRPSFFLADSARLQFTKIALHADAGQLQFTVSGDATAVRTIRTDDIKAAVAARGITEVENYLRGRQEISSFSIGNFPPWRWSAPADTGRISVVIDLPASQ